MPWALTVPLSVAELLVTLVAGLVVADGDPAATATLAATIPTVSTTAASPEIEPRLRRTRRATCPL